MVAVVAILLIREIALGTESGEERLQREAGERTEADVEA